MNLFELDDQYNVNFDPEIFLIEPFRVLKDSRKKKVDLMFKELAYVYFYCDASSDFGNQIDHELKQKDIIKYVKLPEDWAPDDKLEECMKVYTYLSETVSSKLLKTVYATVDKITKHLKDLDLDERDKSGKPIWSLTQVQNGIKGIPDLLKSIRQAESEYIKGKDINDKLRGDKIKTLYEDGIITRSFS